MNIYAPQYYTEFCCIADKCKHNCCIGWEIDIDEDTYKYYRSADGHMGKKLAEGIHIVDGSPCFCLGDDERCPMLNNRNLCDIIANLGEDKLCNICRDHPRYRNYYASRTEIGLGLCCEEAARIVLTQSDKIHLVRIDTNEEISIDDCDEDAFFALRQKAFDIVQNRNFNMTDRIYELCKLFDITLPDLTNNEWADAYCSLERLDTAWNDRLSELRNADIDIYRAINFADIPAEQLLTYFLYRHMAEGIYDGMMPQRVAFAVVSTAIIFAITLAMGNDDTETLADTARMYSAEIEYSDENINKLLDMM